MKPCKSSKQKCVKNVFFSKTGKGERKTAGITEGFRNNKGLSGRGKSTFTGYCPSKKMPGEYKILSENKKTTGL